MVWEVSTGCIGGYYANMVHHNDDDIKWEGGECMESPLPIDDSFKWNGRISPIDIGVCCTNGFM